jgi:hypothetical protein
MYIAWTQNQNMSPVVLTALSTMGKYNAKGLALILGLSKAFILSLVLVLG